VVLAALAALAALMVLERTVKKTGASGRSSIGTSPHGRYGWLLPPPPPPPPLLVPPSPPSPSPPPPNQNYGVTRDTDEVRLLLRHVELHQNATPERPVLVHCSGGVGRSGSFLAALYAIRAFCPLAKGFGGEADVAAVPPVLSLRPVLAQLRSQRHPWCVEGAEQYQMATLVACDEIDARLSGGGGGALPSS
jgi:hypothetical protein